MYNELITGIDKMSAIYGTKTAFHDGEIISVLLERSDCILTMKILMPVPLSARLLGETTNYEITLRFEKIEGLSINDFNHQNVIQELSVDRDGPRLKVGCWSVFGSELSFTCDTAVLVKIGESEMKTGGRT
jgi:hypothetical protein